jgi:HAE1 family hydrophobic/amphiphilic exporter-1
MSISELAIKRPTLVVVVFTILALAGAFAYTKLKYNLLPKFDAPTVTVATIYPGAGAYEVQNSVTKVLEDAVSGVENINNLRSTSQEGLSLIIIELNADANVDAALQDAQRKINEVLTKLPNEAGSPALSKINTDDFPVVKLAVTANITDTKLHDLAENEITARLSKISGVGQVNLIGGAEREIHVNINVDKLKAYQIGLNEVLGTIQRANAEFPTGKIENKGEQYTLRLGGKIEHIETLRNLYISGSGNKSPIKLSDLADVEDGLAESSSISRYMRNNSLGINVRKQSDANAVAVSEAVRKEVALLEKQHAPEGLKMQIVNDSSVFTLASAHAVMEDLVFAIILVALVMLVFLHSLRNALIVMVSIPTSIISVFAAMYVMDFSLNLMTLMGLSLVVGILVDDSIVVLENIQRHLEMGKDKRQAAIDGRNEIGFTAVSITLVDVVVFLPLAMVSGLIGNILKEFALVVVFSTLMSLVVSFTITPLLASRFGKVEDLNGKGLMARLGRYFEHWFTGLQHWYEGILVWCLSHKRWVFIGVIVIFVASLQLVSKGFIGTTFIKESDRGELVVKLEGAQNFSLEEMNALTMEAEKILMQFPEVKTLNTSVGYTSSGFASSNNNYLAEMTVGIGPKTNRTFSTEDFGVRIKPALTKIPGLKVSIAQVGITGNATENPIQILVQGPDIEAVAVACRAIQKEVKLVPGTSDVSLSNDENKPELTISLDRDKMAQFGVSVQDIGLALQTAFAGQDNEKFREGPQDYAIRLELDQFDRREINDVAQIPIRAASGKLIELKEVTTIAPSTGAGKLERYNRIASRTVNSNVIGRPIGTVGEEIKGRITKLNLSAGTIVSYKGNLERQADAFGSLGLALLVAIILIYLVMVALYNSYLYPFVVLFSIPVALVGALLALALAREDLSLFSIVGLIMLLGLVSKNAILIVDFTNQLKDGGLLVRDALIEAGKERLRPILMTTLAMVLGMLPIAMATGNAAEIKNGMAWVIIGGLSSSLILTLVLVPAVYMVFEGWKNKLAGKKAKSVDQPLGTITENLPLAIDQV